MVFQKNDLILFSLRFVLLCEICSRNVYIPTGYLELFSLLVLICYYGQIQYDFRSLLWRHCYTLVSDKTYSMFYYGCFTFSSWCPSWHASILVLNVKLTNTISSRHSWLFSGAEISDALILTFWIARAELYSLILFSFSIFGIAHCWFVKTFLNSFRGHQGHIVLLCRLCNPLFHFLSVCYVSSFPLSSS